MRNFFFLFVVQLLWIFVCCELTGGETSWSRDRFGSVDCRFGIVQCKIVFSKEYGSAVSSNGIPPQIPVAGFDFKQKNQHHALLKRNVIAKLQQNAVVNFIPNCLAQYWMLFLPTMSTSTNYSELKLKYINDPSKSSNISVTPYCICILSCQTSNTPYLF